MAAGRGRDRLQRLPRHDAHARSRRACRPSGGVDRPRLHRHDRGQRHDVLLRRPRHHPRSRVGQLPARADHAATASARPATPSCSRTATRARSAGSCSTAGWRRAPNGIEASPPRRASTTASPSTSRSTAAGVDDVQRRDLPHRLLRRRGRAPVLDDLRPCRAARRPRAPRDATHRPGRLRELGHVRRRSRPRARGPSGVYLLRLVRNDNGDDTHILLVVRDDGRTPDSLFGIAVHHLPGVQQLRRQVALRLQLHRRRHRLRATPRAVKVSFDRPVRAAADSGQHDWYTRNDIATVHVARAQGYDVSYIAVADLERTPRAPAPGTRTSRRAHDEYYVGRDAHRARAGARRRHRPLLHGRQRGLLEDPLRAEPGDRRQDRRVSLLQDARRAAGPDPERHPDRHLARPGRRQQARRTRSPASCTSATRTSRYFPLRVSAAAGQRPHLALHRPRRLRPPARPRRSARRSSAGSGTRASTTASSRPA